MSAPTLLIASPNCAPFTQTGAWSSFTQNLSKELRKGNSAAAVVLPWHPSVGEKEFVSLRPTGIFLTARNDGANEVAEVLECKEPGHTQVLFLKSPAFVSDDGVFPYLYFSKITVELAKRMDPIIQSLLLIGWQTVPVASLCRSEQLPFSCRSCLWSTPTVQIFDHEGLEPTQDLVTSGLEAASRIYLIEEPPGPTCDERYSALALPETLPSPPAMKRPIRIAVTGGEFSDFLPTLDHFLFRGVEIVINGEIHDPSLIRFFRDTQERFPDLLTASPYGDEEVDIALFLPGSHWNQTQIDRFRSTGTLMVTRFYGENLFPHDYEGRHYYNESPSAIQDCLDRILNEFEKNSSADEKQITWESVVNTLTESLSP